MRACSQQLVMQANRILSKARVLDFWFEFPLQSCRQKRHGGRGEAQSTGPEPGPERKGV